MTNQPVWRTLWSTDRSRLLIDETGVYDAELEICQEIEDSGESITCPDCDGSGIDCENVDCEYDRIDTGNTFEVFRICLERYKMVTSNGKTYMVPFKWNTGWLNNRADSPRHFEPWFYPHLGEVASSSGLTEQELVGFLCSDNPGELANAYEAIAGHFGFHEFDSEPMTLIEAEFDARWSK